MNKENHTHTESRQGKTREEQLRERIHEPGIFTSPVDREIALDILTRLEKRFQSRIMSDELYNRAVNALDALVPKINEHGERQIADVRITSRRERDIQSRLTSQEVDVCSPEGSWGKLPEVVKKQIAQNCELMIETHTNCTVRCPFCSFADKGPIKQKMSFPSIVEILTYFRDNQPPKPDTIRVDNLYWDTDPFDIKWETPEGERDYTDLAQAYWGIMNGNTNIVKTGWNIIKGKAKFLYTSTAMPVGEEFRVFRFADMLIKKKKIGEFSELRISKIKANKQRAEYMQQILEALHPNLVHSKIEFSERNENDIARRGKAWDKKITEISVWDITGPNCRDDVIIGVHAVDGVIMLAGSNEQPNGEQRFPIMQETADGIRYTIPHHQEKPDWKRKLPFKQIYPDPTVTFITENSNRTEITTEQVHDNPHRTFLRIVGASVYVIDNPSRFPFINRRKKRKVRKFLAQDIAEIQAYLASGADNKSMKCFMTFLKEQGFIS